MVVTKMESDVNANASPPHSSAGSDFIILSRPSSGKTPSDVVSAHFSMQLLDSITSEMSLEEAVDRLKSLMIENMQLKENLIITNETMKKQLVQIQDWKQRYDLSKAEIREKYELTKRVVETLKQQKKEAEDRIIKVEAQLRDAGNVKNKEENEEFRKQVVKLAEMNEFLEQNKQTLQNTVDELSGEIEDMRKKLEIGSKRSIEEVVVQCSPEYIDLKKQLLQQQQQIDVSRTNIQEKDEQIHKLSKDNTELKTQVDESHQGHHRLKSQMSITGKEVNELKVENTSLKSKLQKTREINDRLILEKNDLIAMNNQLSTDIATLRSDAFRRTSADTDLARNNEAFSMLGEIQEGKQELELHQRQSAGQEGSINEHKQVSELVQQLTDERDKVTDLQNEVSKLQKQLDENTELVNRQAENRHRVEVDHLRGEVESYQRKILQTKQNVTTPPVENVHQYKAQVTSLVSELKIAQEQLIVSQNQCATLQQRTEQGYRELEEQRSKDDALIDSLRITIGQIEATLNNEKQEKDAVKRSYGDLRNNFDQLCKDYHELLDEFESYRAEQEEKTAQLTENTKLREKLDKVTAQVFSAEEIVRGKDEEIKQIRQELVRLQHKVQVLQGEIDTIPILKATIESYRSDFNDERSARERIHEDNERLKSEINDLQIQNQQLQDEVQNLSRTEMREMMHRHGTYGQRAGYPYPGLGNQQPQTYQHGPYGHGYHDNSMGTSAVTSGFQEEHSIHRRAPSDHSSEDEPITCPKCQFPAPDLDTLQIHLNECLD